MSSYQSNGRRKHEEYYSSKMGKSSPAPCFDIASEDRYEMLSIVNLFQAVISVMVANVWGLASTFDYLFSSCSAKYKGRCCRKNKLHEVHDEFWQCISVMFTQYPISHSSSDVSESCLTELTRGEDLRYIFPLERAAILYNLSQFILKDCYSEHSRWYMTA